MEVVDIFFNKKDDVNDNLVIYWWLVRRGYIKLCKGDCYFCVLLKEKIFSDIIVLLKV